MRLVQILVPRGRRTDVLDVLDEEGVDYAVFDETGRTEFSALVTFPVPPSAVEPILEKLRDVGIEEDAFTIVLQPETVVSRRIGELKRRYAGVNIAREELRDRAAEMAPDRSTFFSMTVISTIIAATGLLLDSSAVIIGAMVIAPLMGPAMAASVGTVVDEPDLVSRGVWYQITGLLVAIASAALFGFLVQGTVLIPPGLDIRTIPAITERFTPNFLSLLLALGAGAAGVISLMRGAGSVIVGVMIAVALVPPAATVGLGIAWLEFGVVLGGTVNVLVNLLSINLTALALLWVSGYRPERVRSVGEARSRTLVRIGVILVAIAVLSLGLGLVTYGTNRTTVYQEQANGEIHSLFDGEDAPYADYQLVDSSVTYRPLDFYQGGPAHVRIVTDPPGRPPDDIAQRIDRDITRRTGQQTTVEVVFVQSQEST
ncbi:TIGR00341 family protein [Haladaptatus sp. DYF46]|uniref:TIGR00341 family protein n=1 Tax=Haladaptatus sp. DYF46 TaxID=2886041 RepID=UPI001E4C5331|nr:TIGR00341 family protein [Haladaptatus sp. DYF46]